MTFKVFFQKSPRKDIGLIVNKETYRCAKFSGVCYYDSIIIGLYYTHAHAELYNLGSRKKNKRVQKKCSSTC